MPKKWIDRAWKEVLASCADEALLFFLPELAKARNVARNIEQSCEELPAIGSDTDKGQRISDAVFLVPIESGGNQRVVFIVEQQHARDPDFARRMFEGYYRMSDRMREPVTSLAIFTGRSRGDERYASVCFGTRVLFEFNTFAVADADIEVLKRDDRVFAAVILAAALMLKARGVPRYRERYARELLSLMRQRNYDNEVKRKVLTFVGKILCLGADDISLELKEEWNMITIPLEEAVERIKLRNAFEDGLEEGLEKGLEKGLQEGRAEERLTLASAMLRNGMSAGDVMKYTGISRDELERAAGK